MGLILLLLWGEIVVIRIELGHLSEVLMIVSLLGNLRLDKVLLLCLLKEETERTELILLLKITTKLVAVISELVEVIVLIKLDPESSFEI